MLTYTERMIKVAISIGWIVIAFIALVTYGKFSIYIYIPGFALGIITNLAYGRVVKKRPHITLEHPIFYILDFIYITLTSVAVYYTGGLKSALFLLYILVSIRPAATISFTKLFRLLLLITLQYTAVTYGDWRHSLVLAKALGEHVVFLFLISYFIGIMFRQLSRETEEVRQAKEDMVAIVSHELRAPLTSIIGYISLILGGKIGEIGDKQRVFLESALAQAEKLGKIVSGLLDLSRPEFLLEETEANQFNLANLIKSMVEKFKVVAAAAEEELSLETDISSQEVLVQGDFQKIEQVLNNLIENALRFTKKGSVVIKLRANLSEVLVQVVDTGPGILPQHLPHIFEKFYQADISPTRAKGGCGLGLAICKEVVEARGGKIWAESEVGKGSIFSFVLPLRRKGEGIEVVNRDATGG